MAAYTSPTTDMQSGTVPGLAEAIDIGRRAGVPVHISHMSGDEDGDPPDSEQMLALLNDAAREGIDVTFDLYPYTFGSTILAVLLPGWLFEGEWETIKARLSDSTSSGGPACESRSNLVGLAGRAPCRHIERTLPVGAG